MSRTDEASIALWLHYRREPEQFAALPEPWRHSIAEHYDHALKRQQLRQRRSVLPVSVLAALAALSAAKARAAPTQYAVTLTGTTADTAYQSATDANGNLVYRLEGGDGIGITANGAQDVSAIRLQGGTPKVILQVGTDGKGTLNVSAIRPASGVYGTAYAVDVEAGENLTVNGRTSIRAQADDAFRWDGSQWVVGSEAQGLRLIQGTATLNGNLDVDVRTPAFSRGLWIYRGFLVVNGDTTIVAHGKSGNTAGLYNSGGGTGNVVFNGNLNVTGYGDWPSDNVHGIYNDNVNTRLTVNGDMTVSATSNGSTVMGIRNQGNFYVAGNATVTADGPRSAFGVDNTHRTSRFHVGGDLKVTVTNHTGYTPFGLPTALSNMYGMGSSMTLDGAVDASISGVTESYAVNNNGVMSFTNAGKMATLRASVNCAACDVYGIANNGGKVVLAGGLDVGVSNTGSGARYALWNAAADGLDATLSVNPAGGQSVRVDGDVVTRSLVNAGGTHYTGTASLNFDDNASFLKGMVLGGSGTTGTSTYSAGTPILAFAHGARWVLDGAGALASDFGTGSLTLGNDGAIDLAASWGTFAPGSVPAHAFRELRVDSSTGGATVNLADGATFTLLSDIRNAQADRVSFGAGVSAFSAQGTQNVRIAYDPVLDDTSWVSAATLHGGTAIAAARPIAVVDAGAAAGGAAAFKSVAGVEGQWGATYENALVRFRYVPRVRVSGDGKQILLTGIDILGDGTNPTGGTPPASGNGGTGTPSTGTPSTGAGAGTPPGSSTTMDTPTAPPAGAGAIAPSTGVLVAGDAALAMGNLWQVDERAVSRRSEASRLDDRIADAAFWADADGGSLRGDGSEGRGYRQSASSTSAGVEWGVPFDGGHGAVGLVYTHAQSRADVQNGTVDLRGDSAGAYGAWTTSAGWFADAVARVGRLHDSYTSRDAFGMASGRYDARAASVSARVGRRFAVGRGGYVEPQVQAAYGAIGPSSYTSSQRVRFDVAHNRTFQSRAGVLVGQSFGWRAGLAGDLYARVAMTRTVGNRPDVTASLDGGSLPVALPTRHATTGEAALGARVVMGNAWSAFAEAGRTSRTDVVAGGWRAAAGFRWNF